MLKHTENLEEPVALYIPCYRLVTISYFGKQSICDSR